MKRINDPEIRALRDVVKIMDALDQKQCERFMCFLHDKYITHWKDRRPVEKDAV